MDINKNDIYKLSLEDLAVDSFEPSPADPTISALAIDPMGRAWTGCLSDCTECGAALV